jgi:CSLREA domain-containing protein
VGAVLALWALPAVAAAKEFVVNTTVDTETILETPCVEGHQCTLRDAIHLADVSTEPANTISFAGIPAGSHIEVDEAPLPDITAPQVTIEGGTAAGAVAGIPAVELEPINFTSLEGVPGLSVHDGTGTRIEGLAIGGFDKGIEVGPTEDGGPSGTEICGDYLGVEMNGVLTRPNEIGIEVFGFNAVERPVGTVIGNGGSCAGNAISGNAHYGVRDLGLETKIAGNSIGIGPQPNGARMPNGAGGAESAGVFEAGLATGATIGGADLSGVEGNVIAFNEGPGVVVEKGSSQVSIRHDFFEENLRKGIEIEAEAPPAPLTFSATSEAAGHLKVTGSIEPATPDEEVHYEFFGSDDCTRVGEGRTFLGEGRSEEVPAGAIEFSAELDVEVPADEHGITVTATHEAGATSEFSNCVTYAGAPQTFVVTSRADTEGAAGCEDETVATPCTLRGAIEAANKTEVRDTIDFAAAAEGVTHIEPEPLPEVEFPVRIDGTSAPGYAGEPVVELDGTAAESEGAVAGLHLGGGESVVEGLAIGGFRFAGIWLTGESPSRVCSSWIGVVLGEAPLPNVAGIRVGSDSTGNEIGVGCEAGAPPNVIAGNLGSGVEDEGFETKVGGNRIGASPAGEPDGNKEAGVRILVDAFRPEIGSDGGGAGAPAPNQIIYNEGGGVVVASAASEARIRANAIFGNGGKGIEIESGGSVAPTIEAVEAGPGDITVKGEVTSGEQEGIELDFFASAVCNPLDAGEGETFLGSATIENGEPGANTYAASVAAPTSDDQPFITATATGVLAGRTSEFSECFRYEPPGEPETEPEHAEEQKPAQSNMPLANNPPPVTVMPTPTNGEKVVVKPEEGKVKIKLPGTNKYVPLTELKEIPVGAVIDATKGEVHLTSIDPDGTEQSADFFGGVFKVKQKEGAGLVVLELLDAESCKAKKSGGASGKGAAEGSSVSARPASGGTKGKLWGSGHGNFRTEGNDGSATVRGTIWLVEDRCNGTTFFRTRRGIVTVRDFVLHKTLPLPAGNTYVAGEG